MASDVEVLRDLSESLNGAGEPSYSRLTITQALSSAISALEAREAGGAVAMCMTCRHPRKRYGCDGETCRVLAEAREAQPRVEGRMTDAAVAAGYEATVSAGIDRPGTNAYKLKADHLAARASEAVLREIYLPLSVRNGGPEGLARYYRQTRDLIAKLQQDLRAWEAKWLQEKMEHKKTADQVTYWKERADIEAGEVGALSERMEELERRIKTMKPRTEPYSEPLGIASLTNGGIDD